MWQKKKFCFWIGIFWVSSKFLYSIDSRSKAIFKTFYPEGKILQIHTQTNSFDFCLVEGKTWIRNDMEGLFFAWSNKKIPEELLYYFLKRKIYLFSVIFVNTIILGSVKFFCEVSLRPCCHSLIYVCVFHVALRFERNYVDFWNWCKEVLP